eukprot:TRINITY_DN8325_c0_g1_i3.p1 TRINITY_DN8325_c0_g1~~TRINITY_DN8325_c0_g1_i3.p1  ORF type:complete len:1270 (-),score=394.44 TRINITY_DN8325_c0_g1_i3:134-3943(-)
MPLSKCFRITREYEHNEFWRFSSGYIGVYVFFAVMSTLMLFYGGSSRPRRLLTWIADWECFKGCYGTVLMEITALLLILMTLAPTIAICVWAGRTFSSYEIVYTGSEEPALQGTYDNCKTLSAAVLFMLGGFEAARIGAFMWRFRQWMISNTTLYMIGFSALLTLLYIFMLTQTVDVNDDIQNALVFLTLSAIPLFRVIYNYYDDLAVDLNDYLYTSVKGSHTRMLSKGSKWSSWENRWNFIRYLVHILFSVVVYILYACAGTWLDTRASSPGYTLPYIIMVDMATLVSLHYVDGNNIAEVLFSFLTLIFARVMVIYLAWQDRGSPKPGAYEFVEPVFFLLLMAWLTKTTSEAYWLIRSNNLQTIVVEDRYKEWVNVQREMIVDNRAEDGGAGVESNSMKFARCFRQMLFKVGKLVHLSKDPSSKSTVEAIMQRIARLESQHQRLEMSSIEFQKEIQSGTFRINSIGGKDRLYKNPEEGDKARRGGRDGKGDPKKVQTVSIGSSQIPSKETQHYLFMTPEETEESKEQLRIQTITANGITNELWVLKLKQFVHSYKWCWVLVLAHTLHGVVFWFFRDPLDREIWPFGLHARQTNSYWQVLAYSFFLLFWFFVYGGLTTYRTRREEEDDARETFRQLMLEKNTQKPTLSCQLKKRVMKDVYNFRFDLDAVKPDALSYQHYLARIAILGHCQGETTDQPASVDEAVQAALSVEQSESSVGFLDAERSKIAAEAAALATLTKFTWFLQNYTDLEKQMEPETFVDMAKQFQHLGVSKDEQPKLAEARVQQQYRWYSQNAAKEQQRMTGEPLDASHVQQVKQETGMKMMGFMGRFVIRETATAAQAAAKQHGANENQEIAAAILASSWAFSYLESWKIKKITDSDSKAMVLEEVLRDAAKRAASRCHPQAKLTKDKLARAAKGPARFLGFERQLEIVQIANESQRFPEFCMQRIHKSSLDKIHECEAQEHFALRLTWIFAVYGMLITIMYILVVAFDPNREEVFANETKSDERNLVLSVFLPLATIPFFAVARSWQRNNYYYFSSTTSIKDFGSFYAEYQSGLMRPRDKSNVHLTAFALLGMIGWSITNMAVLSATEGFALAIFLVAGMTTILPAQRAQVHRLARNFYSGVCINGFITVVILNIVYWIAADATFLAVFSGLYYTLFCFYLVNMRRNLDDADDFPLFAEADKFWVIPFICSLVAIYKWYTTENGTDTTAKSDIAGILAGLVGGLVLYAIFLFALRREAFKYMDKATKSRDLQRKYTLRELSLIHI